MGERNYHVFYQLLTGTPPQQLQRWGLVADPSAYRYLCSGPIPAEGKDDGADFRRLLEALRILKFSNDEIQGVLAILAGVLLLGNVEFVGTEKVSFSLLPHVDSSEH